MVEGRTTKIMCQYITKHIHIKMRKKYSEHVQAVFVQLFHGTIASIYKSTNTFLLYFIPSFLSAST